MSITRRTGEIRKIPQTTNSSISGYQYMWLVKGFTDCYRVSGIAHTHESQPIFIGPNSEYEWTLDLYVAGYACQSADYVGICPYLRNKERHRNTKFIVQISVLDKDDQKHFTRKATLTDKNVNEGDGIFKDFALRSDLWNKTGFLLNDELKIDCKFFIGEINIPNEVTVVQCTQNNAQEILKKIFDNRQFSDFKLIVGQKEFSVHRAILAATSPVFHAMFESKMREVNEGKVLIEDVEADVMEKTLYFIYVGKLDEIEGLTDKVLAVAERYQLDSLKQLCEKNLVKQLNVENVYETLLLADQNNAEELKRKAIEFFLKNAKKLFVAKLDFKTSVGLLPASLQTEIICSFVAKF